MSAHSNGRLNRFSRAHAGDHTSAAVELLGCVVSATSVVALLPGTHAEPAGVKIGVEVVPGRHQHSSSVGSG